MIIIADIKRYLRSIGIMVNGLKNRTTRADVVDKLLEIPDYFYITADDVERMLE